jgi:hypothetical protein
MEIIFTQSEIDSLIDAGSYIGPFLNSNNGKELKKKAFL